MYFREKKTSKRPVLQLVESVRGSAGKVSQRIIVSLGGCRVPDEYRKAVAIEVTHRMAGYERLIPFDDPMLSDWTELVLKRIEEAGKLPGAIFREEQVSPEKHLEEICIDEIDHECSVQLGPYLVLSRAWKSLGLDPFFKSKAFSPEQISTAKISIFNRLIEPCSENELVNWGGTTALNELLDINTGAWGEDRFYRISDKLLGAKSSLETHLRNKERDLFNLDRTILLYDLTNSYFEGEAAGNELAKRSANSKEKRTDCPLMSVGVVLDASGFVITHKIFAGNMNDCPTLMGAIAGLEKIAGGNSKPVVVVDGGMASKKNLKALIGKGYDYVVNGKRQQRVKFAADFIDEKKFRRVEGRDENKTTRPVFVRKIQDGNETVVLCRSDGRRDKEDAIQDNAEIKLIDGLEKLQARILRDDPKLKLFEGSALVNRVIGRLVSRTTRASKLYEIDYDHQNRELSWNRPEKKGNENRELHGCYHLRCSIDMPDHELWKLYITLTRVEGAFRNMKSDLGLRPFHHQTARRCEAHILITILAYHLLRWIEYSLAMSGYNSTWRTVRRRLQTHGYTTIIVPTTTDKVHHTRKAGRPNEVQKLIYSQLGIDWTDLPISRRTYRIKQKCAKT